MVSIHRFAAGRARLVAALVSSSVPLCVVPLLALPALSADLTVLFVCGGERVEATFTNRANGDNSVELTLPSGERLTLPQVVSGSGARYATDTVEFWNKGRGAMFTHAGTTRDCEDAS